MHVLPDGALSVRAEARTTRGSAAAESVYARTSSSRDALLADSRARNGGVADVLRRQREAGLSV